MIKYFAGGMAQKGMTDETDLMVIGIENDAQTWRASSLLDHCKRLGIPGILATADPIDFYKDVEEHPFNPLLHVSVCETSDKPITEQMKRDAMDWIASTMFMETGGKTDYTAITPAVIERGDMLTSGDWEATPEFWEYALFHEASGEDYYARHEHAHVPMR
jgi:hypothetical protein